MKNIAVEFFKCMFWCYFQYIKEKGRHLYGWYVKNSAACTKAIQMDQQSNREKVKHVFLILWWTIPLSYYAIHSERKLLQDHFWILKNTENVICHFYLSTYALI